MCLETFDLEFTTNAKDKHRKALDRIAVVSLFHLRFQKKKEMKKENKTEKVDILRDKKKRKRQQKEIKKED